LILRQGELYAFAAITGVGVYLGLVAIQAPTLAAWLIPMAVIIALRLAAIVWGLRLPVFSFDDEADPPGGSG
jgi:uncharacterized membrane protein YeiH